MIIKQLRLVTACYALKSLDNVRAEGDATIDVLNNGHFVVRGHQAGRPGEVVLIPSSNVLFAICEDKPAKTK